MEKEVLTILRGIPLPGNISSQVDVSVKGNAGPPPPSIEGTGGQRQIHEVSNPVASESAH